MNKLEFILKLLTLTIMVSEILPVISLYVPDIQNHPVRDQLRSRQDSDEDDLLEQDASAPYQNQGDGSRASDGYEDNEPDGPYDETPREEEGQADLERFFDDHLGASEREGMDKENLPSNLVPVMLPSINPIGTLWFRPTQEDLNTRLLVKHPIRYESLLESQSYNRPMYSNDEEMTPRIQTRYIRLPNNRLFLLRQIINGTGNLREAGIHPNLIAFEDTRPQASEDHELDRLYAKASDIVYTEDDDFDKVYVTNRTDKPFRIDDLGGYDPEEDFQDATRDMIQSSKSQSTKSTPSNEPRSQRQDVYFGDPEADTLFNDASETDEVTFAHDPYQTDLEAELQSQPSNQEEPSSERKHQPLTGKKSEDYDDGEGSWINDGVDDMEIPSQSHQNTILEKAARQEVEANKKKDEEDNNQQTSNQDDPDSQRMPNADYLKDYTNEMDDST